MPIKIPAELPAREVLEKEGVRVISGEEAVRQDIRPLRIALLNLMPLKIKTETQLARVLGATPLQVEMTLLKMETHESKTTAQQHLIDFYHPWTEVQDQKFDGLIITGAPIEHLPFEEVTYWEELTQLLDWSRSNVHGLYNLCWGAQAALYHFYGIPKHDLPAKRFGVYHHSIVNPSAHLMRGLDERLPVPVSRHTETRHDDIAPIAHLEVLLASEESGLCLVYDHRLNHVHMFNHLEYDSTTLHDEYERDIAAGAPIELPRNYYPGDDPAKPPLNCWRSNAHVLYGNWINLIYQTAPHDMDLIGADR